MASNSKRDPFSTPEPGPSDIQAWRKDADAVADALRAAVTQMDSALEGVRNGLSVNIVDVQAAVQVAVERGDTLRRHLSLSGVDPLPEWSSLKELPATVDLLNETLLARRRTVRRGRLMALKTTLSEGQVKHRLQRRRNQLTGLRDAAIEELGRLAAQETPPTLPGSVSGEHWLSWAWNLSPEQMDQLLDHLEGQFDGLIAFLEQVEPNFWSGDLPEVEIDEGFEVLDAAEHAEIISEPSEPGLNLMDATRSEAADASPPQLVPGGDLPPLPRLDVDPK